MAVHEGDTRRAVAERPRRRVARWQWILGFAGCALILIYGYYDVRMLAFMDGQKAGIAHGICLGKTQDLVTCQRSFPLKAYESLW